MKDKWIDDLKQKMKGHTEVEPEGLWSDLEKKLFNEEKGKVIPLWSDNVLFYGKEEKVSKYVWFKKTAGIVASFVLLITGGVWLYFNTQEIVPYIEIKESNIVNVIEPEAITDSLPKKTIVFKTKEIVKLKSDHISDSVVSNTDLITPPLLELDIVNPKRVRNEEAITLLIDKEKVEEIALISIEEDIVIDKNISYSTLKGKSFAGKTYNKRGFSLGLLSGNLSSNSSQLQNGYASMNGSINMNSYNPTANTSNKALLEIYKGNLEREVNTKIDHKRPIRFGLSVYYQLGEKWGVNTGLIYTKLSSTLNSGSVDYKVMGEQTLHYIGVPIQVNYNVWKKGDFYAYVNGGASVEKSVYGTFKAKYKVNDKIEDGTKENIHAKGIQLSVNASVGVEYKLGKGIGVFLEPEMRYHFDDGSSISNIYKEKPFNFNVQMGLRYSIPHKKSKSSSKTVDEDLKQIELSSD
ncbi:PorT family protein [Myroides sp. M-43]|uniref:outer membrane beta-barrel protein n=1 Tax=Myroides oncorhynchi TaxID=2893756 RepID=UPI001E2B2416|nr:outer membrane beta-barrel protein [Myroides oncorhynchi]MCC9044348.1 PorT family protein [Myroides oncorhynchi]